MGRGKRNPNSFGESPLAKVLRERRDNNLTRAPFSQGQNYHMMFSIERLVDKVDEKGNTKKQRIVESQEAMFYCLKAGCGESSLIARNNGEIYELRDIKPGDAFPFDASYKVRDGILATVHPRGSSPFSVYERIIKSKSKAN